MVSVGGGAVAEDFPVDAGLAAASVFEFFEDKNACALAEDKAVAAFIEWAGGAGGFFVAGGEGFHGAESAHTEGNDSGFTSTCDDEIGLGFANEAPALADGVGGGGASGDDGEVGSAQSEVHGDVAGGDIIDHHGDHKRGDFFGSTITQNGVLFLEGAETPNARSDKDACAIGVQGGAFESCISPSFGGSAHGEVSVAIGAANVLGIFEHFYGIEVTNFACEAAVIAGSIEGGNRTDATGALEEA